MKKLVSGETGPVIYWHDYISSKYKKNAEDEPVVEYRQSNTELDGYSSRTVGVAYRAGGYIVSVALSKEDFTAKTEKSGRGVIVHRIKQLIANGLTTGPKDKGITWVPTSYLNLLYTDKAAYDNLFGPIDPTTLKMAINMLSEALEAQADKVRHGLSETSL